MFFFSGATVRRMGASLLVMLNLAAGAAIPALADHVGGGFTAGGIQGQYFNNTTLTGPASFTRQDTRINFNWGTTHAPGGSSAVGYNTIGTTNYSAQWTGAVIPRFSETYTLKTITAGGVKLFVRPTGNPTWTTVINDWTIHTVTTDTGAFAMTAGTSYDIQMQYVQTTGSAQAVLHWSSASTPEETIDPTGIQSINIDTYGPFVYADRMKNSRDQWLDMNFSAAIGRDANGWPTQDGSCMTWEGVAGNDGTYTIQFNGKAQVTCPFSNLGTFWVGATNYGNTLPSGAGYNSGTNTTTATMVITDTGWENMIMGFSSSQRTAASALNTGITNLKIMKPIAEGSATSYDPSVVFTSQIENAASPFVGFRWLGANFSLETNWADRCTPAYSTGHKDSMGTNGASDIPWEYLVRYANETGKDLWITIPEQATGASGSDTTSYVYQLAQLILNGDTINGVVYPGLNPNLRLYFEYSNEVWNYGFPAWSQNFNAAKADTTAPMDANGLIITYDGNTDANIDWNRRQALRMQQSSDIFRAVWGDAAMPGTSAEPRIRPCMETQYDNGGWPPVTETEVEFLNDYFNNADGVTHVSTPHPLSYYLWGEGGATYYNSSNNLGILTTIVPTNFSFESGTTGWTFTGNAGVVANGNALGNPNAPDGTNAAHIGDTGSISQTINFTSTGTFVVNVQMAGPASNSDPIDFYLDGTRITPDRGDTNYVAANAGTVTPPGGSYSQYSSFLFTLGSTGNHTIKFVGTGAAGTHSFLDFVKIGSVDAVFAAEFPADGQNSNSAITQANYIARTNIEVNWARRYGLHETSYEGGWALGGDAGGFPIQNYAKYVDARAKGVQILDTNLLAQSGVDMQFFGTYATWLPTLTGTANPAASPLYQGIQDRANNLAAEPNNGVTVPATLIPTNSVLGENQSNGALTAASSGHASWIDWSIIVPATASYTISASCTASGTAVLSVDDSTILATGPSGGTLSGAAMLTKGLHTVQVRSTGTLGFTVNNVVVSNGGPPPPPSTPTGLTATAGNTQILLTWNPASQATSYNVYRGTTSGGESGTAVATNIAVTNYINSGLTNGTTYYYTVKAVNSGGMSGASNEASATPVTSGAPVIQINTGGPAASPFIADVDFTGGGTATNWTGAIDTSAVLSPAPQAVYQSERFGASTYTIPGLTANASYVVRLHFCENYFGASGNRVFNVAINGNPVLTNFDIFTSTGATHKAGVQQFTVNANGSGQMVIALTNVTNNALINGIEVINTTGGSAPPAPTGLTATAGNAQVVLAWTASSGATSYNVLRSTVSGSGYASVATGIATTSYTNTGLTNGTTYYFVVTATNSIGTSGNSNQASATPQPSIPAAPTGLTATPGNAQVALSWTASTGATSYNVLRSTVNGSGYASVATGIVTTNYTNTGLANGTTYYFVVTATNSAGTSGNSNQASATPSAGGGGTLLASEPFGEAAGALNTASGGAGWNGGWQTQNNDVTIPGYNINSGSLSYSTLTTSGNGAVGGTAYLSTGRILDVSAGGPFGANGYLTGGLIGATGKTVWMSVLIRKDGNNQQPNWIGLHAVSTPWNDYIPLVTAGYFGAASESGGTKYWSLEIGTTVYRSNAAITIGTTALLVVQVNFGATNTVNLYVNPASLGGSAPGTASASGTTATSMAFQSLAYYAGDNAGQSTIDEIRFGDTYAVVTPTTVAPPAAPTGLTATAGNAQVALSWTASSGATSYSVLRSTVSGSGYASVATGIATTSYTNTGLTNGTTYYFVVTATNSGGTSGNSNQASATPASSGTLLASEPFGEAAGALQGANTGTGWGAQWDVQNFDVTNPGYNIGSGSLAYTGLTTTGNRAVGGNAYLAAGRVLDVTAGGPFGSHGYLSSSLIGASGKTVWMSVLLRKDANTDQVNSLMLHATQTDWNASPALVSVGYFGAASGTGVNRKWSLQIGSTTYQSSVAVTTGATALLVLRIDFGATNTCTLYVNPASLGGAAPGTSSASGTTTTSVAFKNLAYYAGDIAGQSSLDEIKFGDTYAIVTK